VVAVKTLQGAGFAMVFVVTLPHLHLGKKSSQILATAFTTFCLPFWN